MRLIRQTLIMWSVSLEKMAAHENDGSPGDGKETWEPLAHRRIDRPQWEQVIMSWVNFRLSKIHIQLNHCAVTHFSGPEPKLCLAAHRLFQIIELIIPQIETNLRSIWLVEALRVSNSTTISNRNNQELPVANRGPQCSPCENATLLHLPKQHHSAKLFNNINIIIISIWHWCVLVVSRALLANPEHSLVVITDKGLF
jgi:hypothetical protein